MVPPPTTALVPSRPTSTPVGVAPMDVPVEVSVVLAVRDGEPHLAGQLAALAEQRTERSWELLVVDAGSRDGTARVLARWRSRLPQLRVLTTTRPVTSSVARNLGAGAARADRLLFCDHDDRVDPGWLDALADGLDRFDLVGGARDLTALNSDVARSWAPLVAVDALGEFAGRPVPIGACSGCRREAFSRLDGFDERFGAGEDVDLAVRAADAGLRVGFVPGARVAYRLRSTPWAAAVQARRNQRWLAVVAKEHGASVSSRRCVHVHTSRARWLLRHVPHAWGPPGVRGRWWRAAGHLAGSVEGCLRSRVRYAG